MRHLVVLIIGFVILVALYSMEAAGYFIVASYTFLKVLCALLALLFFPLGTFLWKKNPTFKSSMSTVFVCLLLLMFGFSMEFLPTSPRKRFYVLAHRIKHGDSVEQALATLKEYDTSSGYYSQTNSYYVYSSFTPQLGTTDRVGFGYDPNTRKIVEGPNYNPD